MIKCSNCGKELEDGSLFCDECGTRLEQAANEAPTEAPVETTVEAANEAPTEAPVEATDETSNAAPAAESAVAAVQPDGNQIAGSQPTGNQFTGNQATGNQFTGNQTAGSQPVQNPPAPNAPAKKTNKLLIAGLAVAGIVVVLLVAIAGIGVLLSSSKSSGKAVECAMYVKDDELFFSNLKSKEPLQVTEKLARGNYDNEDFVYSSYSISSMITISDDGKYLFFPDRIDDGYTIYYSKMSKLGEEAVKIDSNITGYVVNDNAAYVTYLKNDTLYSYNMKKGEKEKIAGDVDGYHASDDGKQVYYWNNEDTLYLWTMGKGKEKIDSNVDTLENISDDFKTVYYTKEDKLYKNGINTERDKIASDVSRVLEVYDSGSAYYFKQMDLSADMFFEDGWDEDAWQERQIDNMLSNQSIGMLCYYDGKKEIEISIGITNDWVSTAWDVESLVFCSLDVDNFNKLDISEVSYYYPEDDLAEAMTEALTVVMVQKGEAQILDIEAEDVEDIIMSVDGKQILYTESYGDDEEEGDLYRMTITGSKASDAELLESDVDLTFWGIAGGSHVYYFTDVKDRAGDLYVDGKLITSDVYVLSQAWNSDVYYFYTDYDRDKRQGTLQCYADGKVVQIADDVHDYSVIGKEKLLVLNDYSMSRYKGDLYLYNKKKLTPLDEDVVCILHW